MKFGAVASPVNKAPRAGKPTRSVLAVAMLVTFAAIDLASPRLAAASPCRPERGYRNVSTLPLDASMLAFMQQVRFAKTARLYTGPPGIDSIKGIEAPAKNYAVKVDWTGERAVFSFEDDKGRAGTLTLVTPSEISMFEIDTFDGPADAADPALYREWTLTGKAAGAGSFAAANASGERLSLILQGRGNDCIAASDDFKHWTLVMEGPDAAYVLFGDLIQAE
jgi:hypothetical protein